MINLVDKHKEKDYHKNFTIKNQPF